MVRTRRSPLPLGGLTQAGRQALDRCGDPRVKSLKRVNTYSSRMSAANSNNLPMAGNKAGGMPGTTFRVPTKDLTPTYLADG